MPNKRERPSINRRRGVRALGGGLMSGLAVALLVSGCSSEVGLESAERALQSQAEEAGFGGKIEYRATSGKGGPFLSIDANVGEATPEEARELLVFIEDQLDSSVTDQFKAGDSTDIDWKTGGVDVRISEDADLSLLRSISTLAASSDQLTDVSVSRGANRAFVSLKPCGDGKCIADAAGSTGEALDEFYERYLISSRGAQLNSGEYFTASISIGFINSERDWRQPDTSLELTSSEEDYDDMLETDAPVVDAMRSLAEMVDVAAPYRVESFRVRAADLYVSSEEPTSLPDPEHESAAERLIKYGCEALDEIQIDRTTIVPSEEQECQ